jgi:hypothetical protein
MLNADCLLSTGRAQGWACIHFSLTSLWEKGLVIIFIPFLRKGGTLLIFIYLSVQLLLCLKYNKINSRSNWSTGRAIDLHAVCARFEFRSNQGLYRLRFPVLASVPPGRLGVNTSFRLRPLPS